MTILSMLTRHEEERRAEIRNNLMGEIVRITGYIQHKFPAQYEHLTETPLFLKGGNGENTADFERYLEVLKTQLKTFESAVK